MLSDIFIEPFADMIRAPDFLMQVLWEGLVSGVLYALIALGFVLICRSSRIFNFGQGSSAPGPSWALAPMPATS